MALNAVQHPAGMLRRPLIALRIVQVILSALLCAGSAWLFCRFGATYKLLQADRRFQERAALDPEAGAVLPALRMLVIASAVSLAFTLTSLVCSAMLLLYTVSPKRRTSSCTPCEHYSCDLGWDCIWAALWGADAVYRTVMAAKSPSAIAIGFIVVSAAVFAMYVATAVMSGKVRRALMAQKAQQGMAGGKDIETAAGAVAEPVCKPPPVVKPM